MGFCMGMPKKLLGLVQLILHVAIKEIKLRSRPVFKYPYCKASMMIVGFRLNPWKPG